MEIGEVLFKGDYGVIKNKEEFDVIKEEFNSKGNYLYNLFYFQNQPYLQEYYKQTNSYPYCLTYWDNYVLIESGEENKEDIISIYPQDKEQEYLFLEWMTMLPDPEMKEWVEKWNNTLVPAVAQRTQKERFLMLYHSDKLFRRAYDATAVGKRSEFLLHYLFEERDKVSLEQALITFRNAYTWYLFNLQIGHSTIHTLEQPDIKEEYVKEQPASTLTWEGDKTSLIILIKTLKEAGLIKADQDELFHTFSLLFNINLKDYQNFLSKNIHRTNNDYVPKIFEKLKQAYLNYREKQLDKRDNL